VSEDNTGAVYLVQNQQVGQHTHFIREMYDPKELTMKLSDQNTMKQILAGREYLRKESQCETELGPNYQRHQ
jgi:hypothetical protein